MLAVYFCLRRSGLAGNVPRGRRSKRDRARASLAAAKDGGLRCDSLGCIANVGGRVVALMSDPGAVGEDCPRAHLVIAFKSLYGFPCRGPRRIITRRDLSRGGTHAVWFEDGGGIRVETVAASRGVRPWTGGRLR